MPTSTSVKPSALNRRQSLQIGAASAASAMLVAKEFNAPAEAGDLPRAPKTTPFVVALPVYAPKAAQTSISPPYSITPRTADGECGRPPHQNYARAVASRYYTVRVKEGRHDFHPELPLQQKIWGYDGIYPGPTFVERYGVPAIVRIYNDLDPNSAGYGSPEISTHLHNLHCGAESDGYAGDFYSADPIKGKGPTLTAPGAYKDHHYPHCYAGVEDPRYSATNGDPREALGTLWYHDHRENFTAPNVYRGLAGFYLLFDDIDSGNENDPNRNHPDPAKRALCLPSGVGKYDIPLLFQDKRFDSSGYMVFDPFENKGLLGNKFCVNGKIQPFFKVERRKYRFRLLDGGPARFYEFYLTDRAGANKSFIHIAADGNLLPAPLTVSKVQLSPAERADIVIDFSNYNIGDQLFIVNRLLQDDGRGPEGSEGNPRGPTGLLTKAGTQLLRFDVSADPPVPDASRVPATLRELPPIDLKEVVKTRKFEFDKVNEVWTVNGKIFDVEKPTAIVKRNTAEIWTLIGHGSWHHPVHIHFEEGRILSRNGKPPPPHEAGRRDVYVLAPDEEVKVFIRFRDFTGKYMMHCHNTTHEDHAMMIRYDIVD